MYTKEKLTDGALNLAGLVVGGLSVSSAMDIYSNDKEAKTPLIIIGSIMPIGVLFGIPSGSKKISTFVRGCMAGATAGCAYVIGQKIFDKSKSTAGVGATRSKTKKFYVYAGYYENYISTKPMPEPYVLDRTFRSIDAAIDYAEGLGDEVIYCENVKDYLPVDLYEILQDNDYDFFEY